MDILHLVDRLEELVNESRPLPMHKILVDEDRLIDIIDQMRVSIPEEVKRAQKVMAERDKLLAQAHEEADRMRQIARDERDKLVEQDPITEEARQRASTVIDNARQEAEGIRNDADDYVIGTLEELEAELVSSLQQVRNGLFKLKVDRGVVVGAPPEEGG